MIYIFALLLTNKYLNYENKKILLQLLRNRSKLFFNPNNFKIWNLKN